MLCLTVVVAAVEVAAVVVAVVVAAVVPVCTITGFSPKTQINTSEAIRNYLKYLRAHSRHTILAGTITVKYEYKKYNNLYFQ